MCLVLQFGMNSLYVMVVHEIVEVKISHILKIFYCMSDFKIVVVIMSAVKCFVKGIVGYTVESLPVYPAAVISVNNLSHKPEIFLDLVCGMAENPHKIKSSTSAASRRIPSISNSETQKRITSQI